MLRLCVALGIVAAAVCMQWSIPLRRNLLPALSPSLLKVRNFVHWRGNGGVVGSVFPRLSLLKRQQDALLQCEAVVPDGTEVTWYKNHQRLQRQGIQEVQATQVQQEAIEEATNEISQSVVPAATTAAGPRLRVSSLVYIDCADENDVGEYSIEMRTPTNDVYFRNFTLRIFDAGAGQEGSTCNMPLSQLENLPRIYHYAPQAWPIAGGSLTLPCRAQGSNLQHAWYVDNTSVENTNRNYQVLANGDLIIRTVGVNSPTSGTCRVSSTVGSGPPDDITTAIRVRSP